MFCLLKVKGKNVKVWLFWNNIIYYVILLYNLDSL